MTVAESGDPSSYLYSFDSSALAKFCWRYKVAIERPIRSIVEAALAIELPCCRLSLLLLLSRWKPLNYEGIDTLQNCDGWSDAATAGAKNLELRATGLKTIA